MFHVRRRPSDYVPRKRKKKPSGKWNELDCRFVAKIIIVINTMKIL